MVSLSLRFPGCRICRLLMSSFFNGQENINQFFLFSASLKYLKPFVLNTKVKIIALVVFTVSATVLIYDKIGMFSVIHLKMYL